MNQRPRLAGEWICHRNGRHIFFVIGKAVPKMCPVCGAAGPGWMGGGKAFSTEADKEEA